MQFEEDHSLEKLGEIVGFLTAYIVFTAILTAILTFLGKVSSVYPVISITAALTIAGLWLRKVL